MLTEMTSEEVADMIPDGATVMVGGFLAVGTPECIMDALVRKKAKDLTVIANDTAFPNVGIGKLISAGLVRKIYVSHIGTNPETVAQVEQGRIELNLVPQGTLIEQIRAGGAGLGGVLTPTGVGTVVAEGKSVVKVKDREYLLEEPLKADFTLIHARWGDKAGNLAFEGTMRNFSPLMATAAEVVCVQVDEYWENDFLDPDHIHVPGIFIDHIIRG